MLVCTQRHAHSRTQTQVTLWQAERGRAREDAPLCRETAMYTHTYKARTCYLLLLARHRKPVQTDGAPKGAHTTPSSQHQNRKAQGLGVRVRQSHKPLPRQGFPKNSSLMRARGSQGSGFREEILALDPYRNLLFGGPYPYKFYSLGVPFGVPPTFVDPHTRTRNSTERPKMPVAVAHEVTQQPDHEQKRDTLARTQKRFRV